MRPFAFRCLSDSYAKKKAKQLADIVGLMGLDLKLSRSQEIVAQLLGYDDWDELRRVTRDTPETGTPDQMLPPRLVKAREDHQDAILNAALPMQTVDAFSILLALRPTGESRFRLTPALEQAGLRLSDDDVVWHEDAMKLVRIFDTNLRVLYKMSTPGPDDTRRDGLTHVGLRRDDTPEWLASLVGAAQPDNAPLTPTQQSDVAARADILCRDMRALDERIRALGLAPMLVPIKTIWMKLYRTRSGDGHYTALNPEPILHIGFERPGFILCPENEWRAATALTIQLALRREFLDAGWTGEGPEWRVTFREGNDSKQTVTVAADSGGAAIAWATAARGAMRYAKDQKAGIISLVALDGPAGLVNPTVAIREALAHPVVTRGRLAYPERIRLRQRPLAA